MVIYIRNIIRLCLFILWVPILACIYVTAKFLPQGWYYVPIYFGQSIILRILGIRLEVKGKLYKAKPAIYLANHASYIDIIIVCSLLPAICVSKAEVKRWPVFGHVARLAGTIFITREIKDTRKNLETIANVLRQGKSILMFPEGTTSDGNRVLPFKSSFLKVVEEDISDTPITVQPITIIYSQANGKPLSPSERNTFAWFGDDTLLVHVWNLLKVKHSVVEVIYHPIIEGHSITDRKSLAQQCHSVISDRLTKAL